MDYKDFTSFWALEPAPAQAQREHRPLAGSDAGDRFAGAELNHFYWSALPPTVQAGNPFFVTLRARFGGNVSDTNYNGTVYALLQRRMKLAGSIAAEGKRLEGRRASPAQGRASYLGTCLLP